jgi:hypothetical protein
MASCREYRKQSPSGCKCAHRIQVVGARVRAVLAGRRHDLDEGVRRLPELFASHFVRIARVFACLCIHETHVVASICLSNFSEVLRHLLPPAKVFPQDIHGTWSLLAAWDMGLVGCMGHGARDMERVECMGHGVGSKCSYSTERCEDQNVHATGVDNWRLHATRCCHPNQAACMS